MVLLGVLTVELFFFLSGYGSNKSNGIRKQDFLQKRTRGVMLPFIIIQIVLYSVGLLWGRRESVLPFGLPDLRST